LPYPPLADDKLINSEDVKFPTLKRLRKGFLKQ